MNREMLLVIILALVVVLFACGLWAWRRRARRDQALQAPVGEPPAGAETIAAFDGFYVATTVHDQPLERLAIAGLQFRSRMTLTVTTAGIALDLTGNPRLFLPVSEISAVGRATVAIDRVVEKNGLVRLSWRCGTEIVDSYLRAQDAAAGALEGAIAGILPAPTPTAPDPTGTAA